MKLRNKKTGEIGNFYYGHPIKLCVSWKKDDGFWAKQEYNSLAELNEEWEDYEEPKDIWWLDNEGSVNHATSEVDGNFAKNREIGNYFETKEEAEKAVEKLKAWKRLKDKGFRFKGISRDWDEIYFDVDIENLLDPVIKDLDICFGGEE